jgi:cell division protein FtsB
MRSRSRFKYIALSILFVLGSIGFTKTTLEIMKSGKRLDTAKDDIVQLEKDKAGLEESIAYKKTADYVEEKARTELNLAKPGERVYVIKGLSNDTKNAPSVLAANMQRSQSKTLKERTQNLSLWWNLFF